MGREGQRLSEGCIEGVYDVARQYKVSETQALALQENDLETLLKQAGKGFSKLDCMESKFAGANALTRSCKRVCGDIA